MRLLTTRSSPPPAPTLLPMQLTGLVRWPSRAWEASSHVVQQHRAAAGHHAPGPGAATPVFDGCTTLAVAASKGGGVLHQLLPQGDAIFVSIVAAHLLT
jgi:hypothetical protein